MSDISKKILSIEPEVDDVLRPLTDNRSVTGIPPKPQNPLIKNIDPVPDFVNREPVDTPEPQETLEDEASSRWVGLTLLAFAAIWCFASLLFFGLPLVLAKDAAPGLLEFSGLAVLVILPIAMGIVLWVALRRLIDVQDQARRIANAAQALTRPDRDALARTKSLASGIAAEIKSVDAHISATEDRMAALQSAISEQNIDLKSAGLQLSERTDEIGRDLTLQRQALEGISGTFDARMESLSASITSQSEALSSVATDAEARLSKAGQTLEALVEQLTSQTSVTSDTFANAQTGVMDTTVSLSENTAKIVAEIEDRTSVLATVVADLRQQSQAINASGQALEDGLNSGYHLLDSIRAESKAKSQIVGAEFAALETAMRDAESSTLAAKDSLAMRVEDIMAQVRRDLARMETDVQMLRTRIDSARQIEAEVPASTSPKRVQLRPLETDFPPVQPSIDPTPSPSTSQIMDEIGDAPLNLGADMAIENPDDAITTFNPDILRRSAPMGKSFGTSRKEADTGWKWRDMLGGIQAPDAEEPDIAPLTATPLKPLAEASDPLTRPQQTPPALRPSMAEPIPKYDGSRMVAELCEMSLAPSAVVGEGTIASASKAQAEFGAVALVSTVSERLSEPVDHLRKALNQDADLKVEAQRFVSIFDTTLSGLTEGELRARFGSAEGRAYLLYAAATRSG